jgi:hypothetical protein
MTIVEFRAVLLTAVFSLACACAWAERPGLPPAPAGVEDLMFEDFFSTPVGPRGLEPTQRLLALDGKRVRVLGYVVAEENPTPGLFLLTPVPTALADVSDGPADYLPPATLFVHLSPSDAGKVLSDQPGLLMVVGTLEVGNRDEAIGRVSFTRLRLDQPMPAARDATDVPPHSDHVH